MCVNGLWLLFLYYFKENNCNVSLRLLRDGWFINKTVLIRQVAHSDTYLCSSDKVVIGVMAGAKEEAKWPYYRMKAEEDGKRLDMSSADVSCCLSAGNIVT